MGSTAQEYRMQALVGNGSPAIKPADQETLKGSTLHRLTASGDDTIHVQRVTMIAFCDYVSQYLGVVL